MWRTFRLDCYQLKYNRNQSWIRWSHIAVTIITFRCGNWSLKRPTTRGSQSLQVAPSPSDSRTEGLLVPNFISKASFVPVNNICAHKGITFALHLYQHEPHLSVHGLLLLFKQCNNNSKASTSLLESMLNVLKTLFFLASKAILLLTF